MNVLATWWQRLYRGTPAEHAIEPAIARLGIPYRTQFPFYLWGVKFFPDVLLPTIGVILEVDDPSHDDEEKQKADAARTEILGQLGYVVVRCSNEEALSDPDGTVARLVGPLLHRQGPGLPPPPSPASTSRRKRSRRRVRRARKARP